MLSYYYKTGYILADIMKLADIIQNKLSAAIVGKQSFGPALQGVLMQQLLVDNLEVIHDFGLDPKINENKVKAKCEDMWNVYKYCFDNDETCKDGASTAMKKIEKAKTVTHSKINIYTLTQVKASKTIYHMLYIFYSHYWAVNFTDDNALEGEILQRGKLLQTKREKNPRDLFRFATKNKRGNSWNSKKEQPEKFEDFDLAQHKNKLINFKEWCMYFLEPLSKDVDPNRSDWESYKDITTIKMDKETTPDDNLDKKKVKQTRKQENQKSAKAQKNLKTITEQNKPNIKTPKKDKGKDPKNNKKKETVKKGKTTNNTTTTTMNLRSKGKSSNDNNTQEKDNESTRVGESKESKKTGNEIEEDNTDQLKTPPKKRKPEINDATLPQTPRKRMKNLSESNISQIGCASKVLVLLLNPMANTKNMTCDLIDGKEKEKLFQQKKIESEKLTCLVKLMSPTMKDKEAPDLTKNSEDINEVIKNFTTILNKNNFLQWSLKEKKITDNTDVYVLFEHKNINEDKSTPKRTTDTPRIFTIEDDDDAMEEN